MKQKNLYPPENGLMKVDALKTDSIFFIVSSANDEGNTLSRVIKQAIACRILLVELCLGPLSRRYIMAVMKLFN
jgi:hypothetical protein